MPEIEQKLVETQSSGARMMEVLDKIRDKIDTTREEVIKQGTRQEEDRKRHDERHLENLKWREEHNTKHDDIMKQLKDVSQKQTTLLAVPKSKPIDKNRLMTFCFIGLFLLIALIYGLTGNDMPSVGDLANIASGIQ